MERKLLRRYVNCYLLDHIRPLVNSYYDLLAEQALLYQLKLSENETILLIEKKVISFLEFLMGKISFKELDLFNEGLEGHADPNFFLHNRYVALIHTMKAMVAFANDMVNPDVISELDDLQNNFQYRIFSGTYDL
ncbi:MAG: hypothetical protein ACK40G_11370 [Cytophagaceae bacterium]